jgi:hypothetical protein
MNNYYERFLETLSERYTHKSELVSAIMDILPLERESIYRRLRGDIMFTSAEVMQVASTWNISLDSITSMTPHKTRPFRFSMVDYIYPDEDDYKLLEKFVDTFELAAQDPESKIIEVSHSMPGSFYNKSESLLRFFTMKWRYKYGPPEETISFGEIVIPERMRLLEEAYVNNVQSISKVAHVFDTRFIKHLVDDLSYFHSIHMVTTDELAALKSELIDLMDYIEKAGLEGRFPETGNELQLYTSHTWVGTEVILLSSKYQTLTVIKVLDRNGVLSSDRLVFDKIHNMAVSIMRSSVLMSLSNRLELTKFFDRQRSAIELIGK